MRITFLIGNGFDLNLGLETSYKSFLKSYLSDTQNDSELIHEFKSYIHNNEMNWGDVEIALGLTTEWFYKNSKSGDHFYECYDDFCEKLVSYLVEQESRLKMDQLQESLVKPFAESIGFNRIIQSFPTVQREQLELAASQHGNGFQYQFIDFNYTTTLDKLILPLQEKPNALGSREYASKVHKNEILALVHVHGYTTKDFVLGVNDRSQISATDLFAEYDGEYINQIIKPKANEMYEENTDSKAARLTESADLIYIYGMSIGDTDKLWWQRIIDRLIATPDVHVIIHAHNAPTNGILARPIQTWLNREKKKFLAKHDPSLKEEVEHHAMKRIHIDRSNIFEPLKDIVRLAAD